MATVVQHRTASGRLWGTSASSRAPRSRSRTGRDCGSSSSCRIRDGPRRSATASGRAPPLAWTASTYPTRCRDPRAERWTWIPRSGHHPKPPRPFCRLSDEIKRRNPWATSGMPPSSLSLSTMRPRRTARSTTDYLWTYVYRTDPAHVLNSLPGHPLLRRSTRNYWIIVVMWFLVHFEMNQCY